MLHILGGTGGHVRLRPAPPHTLQSTGQQQRPRGVQSWVSILVPALLHELGGLRQPPSPDSKSLVAGGGGPVAPPRWLQRRRWHGGVMAAITALPWQQGPRASGHLWSCSWRASLWPPGATSGGGREAKPEAGGDGSRPRDLEQMQLGGGGECPMSPWGRQVGPGGDEMAGGGSSVINGGAGGAQL